MCKCVAANNILLMRNCVHAFVQKLQIVDVSCPAESDLSSSVDNKLGQWAPGLAS